MKFENFETAKKICDRIEIVNKRLLVLNKIKNAKQFNVRYALVELSINGNVEKFDFEVLGDDFIRWTVDRLEKKYEGTLIELNAKLEKL